MAKIILGRRPQLPDGAYLLGVHQHLRQEVVVDAADMWSVHVVGRPGYGKSVFLGNLALQFHAAGEGVLVLDVKGDLARAAAARARVRPRHLRGSPPGHAA